MSVNFTTTVRPLQTEDRSEIDTLLRATQNFTEAELDLAHELLDGIFADPDQTDYHGVIAVATTINEHPIVGFLIIGPRSATAGTWDLYWIAILPDYYGRGVAQMLDAYAEAFVRARSGYWLIAETSGQPRYERSQAFYRKQGYQSLCRIADFYAPADDLVIYGKRLDRVAVDHDRTKTH